MIFFRDSKAFVQTTSPPEMLKLKRFKIVSVIFALESHHCRENMAHLRQSRPDSGLGFQMKVLETIQVVLLRSEADRRRSRALDFLTVHSLPFCPDIKVMPTGLPTVGLFQNNRDRAPTVYRGHHPPGHLCLWCDTPCFRANVARIGQSRPDSGLGFGGKGLEYVSSCPLFARKRLLITVEHQLD